MSTILGKRIIPVVIVLSLALSGLGGLVVSAEEAVAEVTAAEIGTLSGSLAGDPDSGSFALYEVSYAGDELLTAKLTPVYRDASQGAAFGMKLYRPDGSALLHVTRADGAYLEVLHTDDAATLILQVYNYSNDVVSFDLMVDGATAVSPAALPEEPEVTEVAEVAEEEAVVEEAEEVIEEEAAAEEVVVEEAVAEVEVVAPEGILATGILVGESIGAFVEVTVVSPSADDVKLELQTVPLDPSFGAAAGFDVFDSNDNRVAQGVPNDTGLFRATFQGDAGESFLVLIYNYAPGQPLAYTLQVTQ